MDYFTVWDIIWAATIWVLGWISYRLYRDPSKSKDKDRRKKQEETGPDELTLR